MYHLQLFGIDVQIAQSIINMWYIMGVLILLALGINVYIRVAGFKPVPESMFQVCIEYFVEFFYKVSGDTMGEKNIGLAPYIGSTSVLLLLSNMSGLFAFEKVPTTDYSVALGFAAATFFVIEVYQIKAHKVSGYFKEMFEPLPFLFPLNIVDKFAPVLSLSLRLFGNITAGVIIIELLYDFLKNLWIPAMAFIPLPLHFYFDIFDATLQTLVFIVLTMELVAKATAAADVEH